MVIQGPAARAVLSLTFASYAVHAIYEEDCEAEQRAEKMIAASILLLLIYLNCRGTKLGAYFQVLSTGAKIIALILVIIIGIIFLAQGEVASFADPFAGSSQDIGSIALAFYPGLYAYSGYTAIVYGLTELKNPERNLPLAIIGGLLLTIFLYVLTNIAYFSVLTPSELLEVDAVALTFGSRSIGMFYWIFSIFVCVSVMGTLNSTLFASSRLYHSAAKQGQMIPLLAMMNVERKTPVPAHMAGAVLALTYLLIGDIYTLINTLGFVSATENFLLISGLIYWRIRRPEIKRPVKYPIVIHFVFVISCLFLLALPWYQKYEQFGIGLGIMCTSLIIYFIFLYDKNARRLPSWLHTGHRAVTEFLQRVLNCVYEEDYLEEEEEEEEEELKKTSLKTAEVGEFINGNPTVFSVGENTR